MTAFDPKSYEAAVVKPLRSWTGRELPDDLLARYAVEPAMSDAELVRRLAEVRSHWNKGAQAAGKSATIQNLYKKFLQADEELRTKHGDALNRIDWWRTYQTGRAGTRQAEIDELANTLRRSFGDLRLITAGQLDATMRATFAALAPDEMAQALDKAGVGVGTPSELPKSVPLSGTMYRALGTSLSEAGARTIPELLFGPIEQFTILTKFTSTPTHPVGLVAKAVADATDRENKRSGNQAARQALGILDHAKSLVDLRELTLCLLLEPLRQHRADGVPAQALLKQLRLTGLDERDARQIVFSIVNEAGSSTAGSLSAIKDLLAEGLLGAAQQALATISGADDATAAKDLVRRHAEQVQQLVESARQALRSGNETAAQRDLQQAAVLAADDDEIAAELRRIPPPPVLSVAAQPEGIGVRVSWRPDTSHGDKTRYRVVRKEGRIPSDIEDGTTVGEQTATRLTDATAPAGRLVGYAVFAAVAGGVPSRSAGVTVEVLPPVHEVVLTAADGVVEGHWQVHPDVLAVEVRRGAAATAALVPTSSRTTFRDKTNDEAEHVYTIIARYRRVDGTEARAVPVVARAVSAGQVAPVTALTLTAMPGGGSGQVRIKWRQAPGTEVTIRRASQPCGLEFGAAIPLSALNEHGTEVVGSRDTDGDWQILTADVSLGHFWYVPFTLAGSGAVCGQEADLGIALPVTGATQRRLGSDVLLSWLWPEGVGVVEIRWRGTERSGKQRLTRQQYQDLGGWRMRVGSGQLDAEVRTVVQGAGAVEYLSAPVSVSVSGLLPQIRYSVDLARRSLRGGGTVRVRIEGDQEVPDCTVLIVAAHGPVMPRRPDDGQILLRGTVHVNGEGNPELIAELPKLRRPFWIRCFIDQSEGGPSAQLIDPPTRQMKVS